MPPGPRSSVEAAASRSFVAGVQQTIRREMKQRGVGRSELARRLGVSAPRVSAILRKGNMTLETAARVFHALGVQIRIVLVNKENGNGDDDG